MKYSLGQEVFYVDGRKCEKRIIKQAVYDSRLCVWEYAFYGQGRCTPFVTEIHLFIDEKEALDMLKECIELEAIEKPKRALQQSTREKLRDTSSLQSFCNFLLDNDLYSDWICRGHHSV